MSSRSEAVLFAGLAANITNMGYNGSSNSSNSILPQLNAGVNFVLNKNVRAFILRAELNITGSKADVREEGFGVSSRTSLNKITVSLAPQAIYNIYNTEKLKAFLGQVWQ